MKFFAKLKAISAMVFSRGPGWGWLLPRTKFDYAREVGDGLGSSTIMAPVLWIARTFPEAPVTVLTDDGMDHDHDMLKVIRKPNDFYSGLTLEKATLISFTINGNAYWIKIRNGQLAVKQLWYVPHWLMEPKWPDNGSQYVSHYEYNPGGEAIRIEIEDVVHFRNGLDPRNIRLGLSDLGSAMREVFTDDEAANFTAALLKNLGIPGLLINPKESGVMPGDKEAVKEWFKTKFAGDRRGEPLVMGGPTEIKQLGFSPAELDLGKLRQIPEERVCALLGIPAAVVGFGTGLEQTKVGATMSEMREMAYESCIIPTQRLIASELENQLLPDFEPNLDKVHVGFDLSNVRVLQEDQNKLAARWDKLVNGGWVLVSEGRRAMGLEVDSSHDIYLRSFNKLEVPKSGTAPVKIDSNGHDKNANRVKFYLPAGKSTQQQLALAAKFARDIIFLTKIFATELKEGFEALGDAVAEAWEEIAEQYAVDYSKANAPELKIEQEDIYADMIGTVIDPESYIDYKVMYLRVAKTTVDSVNAALGLVVNMTDPIELSILAEAGTQKGLLNLSKQTKDSLFQALVEAREEGLGPPAVARRIKDLISKGPWSTPEIRAKIIARTETKHAQNVASLEVYGASDTISRVQIVDGQLPTSDDFCIERNQLGTGESISIEEAWTLSDHPNNTLSFVPVVG